MRSQLTKVPWWVLSIVIGLYFAAFMAVFGYVHDGGARLAPVIMGALIGGMVSGAGMGPVTAGRWERARLAMGDVDDALEPQIMAAAKRGVVPADPVVRDAATALVQHRMAELAGQRPWAIPMFATLVVLTGTLALTRSLWWWLAAAALSASLLLSLVQPARLSRRLKALGR